MENECMLSTVDNPFNPFEDFTSWFMFDIEHNYDSCGRLMREANISDDMSSNEENAETERAIDRIVALDPLNIYTKVTRQVMNA